MYNHYAKGYPIGPPYLWKLPPLLGLFWFLLLWVVFGVTGMQEGGVTAMCNFEC